MSSSEMVDVAKTTGELTSSIADDEPASCIRDRRCDDEQGRPGEALTATPTVASDAREVAAKRFGLPVLAAVLPIGTAGITPELVACLTLAALGYELSVLAAVGKHQ